MKFIRLNKNVGKSGAILEGLKQAKGNFILLLDADLRNLNHIEINNAIKAIGETSDVDMLILRRIKAPLLVKITRGDVLSSLGSSLRHQHTLEMGMGCRFKIS